MPRIFIHYTFLFFTLIALSGVWMRLFLLQPNSNFSYTHVLHGHSHLAMLGWSFVGVFVVFLSITWETIKQKKQAVLLTSILFFVSLLMFAAFLYQGYGVISIIFSTLHIFIEYWAAIFIFRHIRAEIKDIAASGKLFLYAALFVLVLSSIGPYALGFISANGMKDSYLFDMAMYFYLHFQYNGWLTLSLIGLFILFLHTKKITLNGTFIKLGFWIYFISLFPGYFLNVLWADLGVAITIMAAMGSAAQWIGILLILLVVFQQQKHIVQLFPKFIIHCLWITFLLLLVKSTMELGLISPSFANLIYETRSIVIGYLHLTLLGFVSVFILTLYYMQNILSIKSHSGFIVFFIGFSITELLLFSQGFVEWIGLSKVPFYNEGLFGASLLLLGGIAMMWLSFINTKHRNR